MKLLMLTAGTGSFHCGTCLRDNALARGLRELGHDVDLIPLYLPLVTDGHNESAAHPVLMGGLSVYLQQISAVFRALPDWVDAMLDSPVVLSLIKGRSGATDPASLGPMTLSMLGGEDGRQAKAVRRMTAILARREPRPDVVILSNALLLGLAAPLQRALTCPVVCTLQGEDVYLDALPEPAREAAWTMTAARATEVDALIAVSAHHAREMSRRLGLNECEVHVAHNGIDLSGYMPADTPPARPTLGYLARLSNDKGLDTLVEAYVALRQGWEGEPPALWLGGALTPLDQADLGAACQRLKDAGVDDALRVHPNMSTEDKQIFLRGLSVFCVPPRVEESFGLYALEALASGVPVVAPRRGALPEVLEATGGGIVVSDDSPEHLAEALGKLLRDPKGTRALGQVGRRSVELDFSAARMAERVADILSEVAS